MFGLQTYKTEAIEAWQRPEKLSYAGGKKEGQEFSFGQIKFEMPIAQLRGDSSGQLAIRVQSSRM